MTEKGCVSEGGQPVGEESAGHPLAGNREALCLPVYQPKDRKPRTYRAQTHRDFLQFSHSRKKTAKNIRKAVRRQLRYLTRNLAAIDETLDLGRTLSQRKGARLAEIRTLCAQQKYMYNDHSGTRLPRQRCKMAWM